MTTDTELLTPEEWQVALDIIIVDPDGWDRMNFAEDWAKPITRPEFMKRAGMSTVYWGQEW